MRTNVIVENHTFLRVHQQQLQLQQPVLLT